MPTIHPTSVVDRGAQLADDVIIGPLCYVGPKVTIGAGTRLVSHVSVLGKTTIGSGNTIWPQAVLGADPQDLKFRGEETELIIGDDNEIRELVTAHTGTGNGGGRDPHRQRQPDHGGRAHRPRLRDRRPRDHRQQRGAGRAREG